MSDDSRPPSADHAPQSPAGAAGAAGADAGADFDPNDPQAFGKLFIDRIYKILKVASIYNADHNQTRLAVDEFMATIDQAFIAADDGSISVVVRDELAIVNGETLRLRRREQARHNELRDLFEDANIRGIVLQQGLQAGALVDFLANLKQSTNGEHTLDGLSFDSILLEHGSPTRSIREALADVNKAMYVAHVYIRGLVKTQNAHKTVREQQSADIPTGVIRRILQSISELLDDEDFTILGLLPLRLVSPDLSSHSFNSAVYAMLLADRLGLGGRLVAYVGMAVIYQDLDRLVGISVGHRDRQDTLEATQQFQTNLRDVAKMLDRVSGDVISTLRMLLTYERGRDFETPVSRPFYRSERPLHLINRIVDLARTYDLLIQGLQGYKQRTPDLAIQYVQSRAGEAFDPTLVELMVSTLGVYPIGTAVSLSSGEQAVVIRTPSASEDPRRPVVRLLDYANPTVINLSDQRFAHIDIAGSIELDADQMNTASDVFLLS